MPRTIERFGKDKNHYQQGRHRKPALTDKRITSTMDALPPIAAVLVLAVYHCLSE
jgi:hypothetical protein